MNDLKVVLGLSGGIDSAAAAIMLKEKGMDVTALYFDVVKDADPDAKERAFSLCKALNIPLEYVDLSERFEKIIIDPFCESYKLGCTPMPCIVCNPYVKWWILKEYADKIDAKWLATGHYAQIEEKDGFFYIKKSKNSLKDQSYMLAGLSQDILSRVYFPLSCFESKEQVRAFVRYRGIDIPENLKESQDICFVSGDYRDFLTQRGIDSMPGNFVNENGEIIGKHPGYTNFTIGQRKGLGMGFGKPMFVKEIHPESGDVVLCEDDALFTNDILVSLSNFAKYGEIQYVPKEYLNKDVYIKIRYGAKPALARISETDEEGIAKLHFVDAQRAPAFGQYAVFYDGDLVIGCGVIS